MQIDVVLNPAEIATLPERDLSQTTCVVFDVLRATSSIITGLAHGVTAVYPVSTIEEAKALHSANPDLILGGERFGDRIPGFHVGNSPLEYTELAGRSVVTTTTNGTIALQQCRLATETLVGALINLQALFDHIQSRDQLVLVCAGTFETFALEDALAAGALITRLTAEQPCQLTDAALMTQILFERYQHDLVVGCRAARNGQALIKAGREADLLWCARDSVYNIVARMETEAGHLRVVTL